MRQMRTYDPRKAVVMFNDLVLKIDRIIDDEDFWRSLRRPRRQQIRAAARARKRRRGW